jgi:hypothetical protein
VVSRSSDIYALRVIPQERGGFDKHSKVLLQIHSRDSGLGVEVVSTRSNGIHNLAGGEQNPAVFRV